MALYCKKCKEEISSTQYDFYAGYCKNCYGKKVKKLKSGHTESIYDNTGILIGLFDLIGDIIADSDSDIDFDGGCDSGDGIDFGDW